MSTSSTAEKKREAARHTDGTFGQQHRDEPDTALVVEPFRPPEQFWRKYDSVDEKLEAYKAELLEATRNLADDEEWQRYLEQQASFYNYSFNNTMLIWLQCPHATNVGGFHKWKSMGRFPVKDSKAIGILAPKMAWVTRLDKNGNPVIGEDGKPERVKRCVGFTTASVFDVSQTDGEPLAIYDDTITETPPERLNDELTSVIGDEGYSVSYSEDFQPGHKGYTDPRTKQVVVDSRLTPADRARVLAHELGHIKAGHTERLDEYHSRGDGCRGEMEVEADSIAYVVVRARGMSADAVRPTACYIDGWSRNKPEVIEKVGANVAKAAKAILGSTRFASPD